MCAAPQHGDRRRAAPRSRMRGRAGAGSGGALTGWPAPPSAVAARSSAACSRRFSTTTPMRGAPAAAASQHTCPGPAWSHTCLRRVWGAAGWAGGRRGAAELPRAGVGARAGWIRGDQRGPRAREPSPPSPPGPCLHGGELRAGGRRDAPPCAGGLDCFDARGRDGGRAQVGEGRLVERQRRRLRGRVGASGGRGMRGLHARASPRERCGWRGGRCHQVPRSAGVQERVCCLLRGANRPRLHPTTVSHAARLRPGLPLDRAPGCAAPFGPAAPRAGPASAGGRAAAPRPPRRPCPRPQSRHPPRQYVPLSSIRRAQGRTAAISATDAWRGAGNEWKLLMDACRWHFLLYGGPVPSRDKLEGSGRAARRIPVCVARGDARWPGAGAAASCATMHLHHARAHTQRRRAPHHAV